MQSYAPKVANCLLEIYNLVIDHLKPTPSKVHYLFSWRDLFKICDGLQLVETNFLKDEHSLTKLVYHESLRVLGDKITNT